MIFTLASILAAIFIAGALAYHRANGLAWSIALAAGVAALTFATGTPAWALTLLWIGVGVFAALAIVKPLRRAIVSGPSFGLFKKVLPQVSQTEQEALDAGSAPRVALRATHQDALAYCKLEDLKRFAVDLS